MLVLISNDDGIHAPGIQSLVNAVGSIADVLVVAPLEERSTTGHALTLNHPLRLVKIRENHYGCSGYPADCIILALFQLLKNRRPPDLIISGINHGGNLGLDTYYSGTMAAAREGAFHGIPAIALSTTVEIRPSQAHPHFESAADFARHLVESQTWQSIAPFDLLNINVPNLPHKSIKGVQTTPLGPRYYRSQIIERQDGRNLPYYWLSGEADPSRKEEGSDCFFAEQDYITLTPLNFGGKITDKFSMWSKLTSKMDF